jgi:hypothetical protein
MGRPKGSVNKSKEIGVPPEGTGKPPVDENILYIDNLQEVMSKVKELIEEKKFNPGVVQEDESGTVFIDGEPKMVIDNAYLPVREAQLVFQTRKVVREYLKLQNLINNVIE